MDVVVEVHPALVHADWDRGECVHPQRVLVDHEVGVDERELGSATTTCIPAIPADTAGKNQALA